jgi:hypothetical protein
MATTITTRVSGTPAGGTTQRVTTFTSKLWTFRAWSFAAMSFRAGMTHGPAVGGTHMTRVTGL